MKRMTKNILRQVKSQEFSHLFLCAAVLASINCWGQASPSNTDAPAVISTFVSQGQRVIVEHLSKSWRLDLGVIWGFDFMPSSSVPDSSGKTWAIVSERGGAIYLLELTSGQKRPLQGLPQTVEVGQGGLMDVRLHPQFQNNKWVFFSYVAVYEKGQGTIVARAKLEGLRTKKPRLTNLKILFKSSPPGSGGRHFGCRIVFENDNTLYFAVGDRGDRHKAQDLTYPNGKVFRLHTDGSIPADNPFVGRGLVGKRKVLEAIWSWGHRNPQGLAIHPHTGQLWEQEHGPRGGDEINLIEKGKNYGWPIITYGKEYWGPSIGTTHKKGMEQPVKYYVPSIAPSSLMIYSGRLFEQWKGDFFSAALRDPHIHRVVIQRAKGRRPRVLRQEVLLAGFRHRIRHIREEPSTGEIYFSTDSGHFFRLKKGN